MSTVVSARPRLARAWELFLEGVRGSERDFTQGPVGPAIVVLAIPMVLEMCMESLFAVVDVFFVSKLGADAVAAVGLTEGMLTIVYSVAMGLVIGATAVVARRVGEKDSEGASIAAVQVIALGLVVSLVIGVIGAIYARPLLELMGASPTVLAEPARYAIVMLGGCGSVVMLFLNNAIFRAAGDATVAMRVLWLANGINIVLDPMLIFGLGPFPELGVMGAAVATTTGRTMGVFAQLFLLTCGTGRIRIRWRHVRLAPAVMWSVCRISGTGMLQILVDTTSWVVLVRVIATFGSPAVAGYTIGIRTVLFAILPSWGLSNAAATMVGQALGAGKPERAEQAVWTAGWYNMIFLGIIGAVFVGLAPQIVAIYTDDAVIAAGAIDCLRIVSLGFLFFAYGMVLTQAFNGAGDAWTPTWINVGCFWMWQIPLAYYLALELGMGPSGVYWAVMVAFSTLAVVSAVIFRRGRWKLERV
ncbi:MAG TPA: MATE family efflux transporter [Vicinamibacterales bacterium]|nr:MATE family efflux transporter [Vicinamibacterales bacterium]